MKFYLVLLIGLSFSAYSQTYQPTILEHTFESKAFEGERKISIALPTGYSESDSTTKYMVAYLFDGQFNPYFSMVHSVVDYYSQIGEGIPMIIVSIYTENRSLEFTPKWNNQETFDGWRGNCGNAEVLTSSLKNEIMPYIEENFNTNSYRLGIGHSLGGTYVMQDIFKDESLFTGIIAVSPNLNYDDEQIVASGKAYFQNRPDSRTFIYASAGDQGKMESSFRRSLQKLDSTYSAIHPENLAWECQWLDGDGHMSAFLPTFNYAYRAFSKRWLISDEQLEEMITNDPDNLIGSISAFYSELSLFTGMTVEPTNDDWNNYGYALSYFDKNLEAISLFDTAIARFPLDPNLLDSRGEILEGIEKYEEAKQSYQAALDVLEKNKSIFDEDNYAYYSETFNGNIERLTDDFIKYKTLIASANDALEEKNYKQSSKLFTKAFKLDIIRATHVDRSIAIGVFAQAKKFDSAFEQLDLLANKFKWQGRTAFEEDDLMTPLRSDPRWEKFMKIMDQNKIDAD